MLCDNSVGVLYNDSTRMILHENGEQVQYLHKDMREEMCTIGVHPSEMQKKISLIKYFRKYMNDHLLKVVVVKVRTRMRTTFRPAPPAHQLRATHWPDCHVCEHGSGRARPFACGCRMARSR